MPRPYSGDLRARVIEEIATGASRREAAERYGISPSVVVIWAQRLETNRKLCGKAEWRQHFTAGRSRRISAGFDCQGAGPDVGRDRRGDGANEESRAAAPRFGGSSIGATSALKKTLYAAEQKRADVARARRRWMREQGMFDPARLVFIDETCTNTAMVRLRGRAPRGERLVDYAPHGHWKTITFVGGLRQRGMTAPFVIEGAMNGPMFLAYVQAMPCPNPQARRDRAHGQSAGAQGRRRRGGDRSGGRDADLSSEVFARPQPDRTGLQQTQGASAQGGRAYDPAPLASDRSRCYRFQRARMQELLSPCGLCSNMTGIRSFHEIGSALILRGCEFIDFGDFGMSQINDLTPNREIE